MTKYRGDRNAENFRLVSKKSQFRMLQPFAPCTQWARWSFGKFKANYDEKLNYNYSGSVICK